MKNYVRIQSNATFMATGGLQSADFTKYDSDIKDRLKVQPLWPQATILIREGAHYYPAEIAEWPTLKNLVKDGVITIGELTDELPANEDASELLAKKEELNDAAKEVIKHSRKKKDTPVIDDISLESIGGK